MKKVTVAPGELFTVKHKVPRRRVVEFKVIANDPVDTYVLNESELKRLRMGRKYETYGGFDGRTFHHQVVELFDLRAPDSCIYRSTIQAITILTSIMRFSPKGY